MDKFLAQIAKIFYREYESELSDFAFVFSNRRSGLFFRNYLAKQVGKPLFSPRILTINELFASYTNLRHESQIALLFRLYKVFVAEVQRDETFDRFLDWGETLLSDFNDIDKYQVDAKQLFCNIADLQDIASAFGDLTLEQEAVVLEFWSHFVPVSDKTYNQGFLSTWRHLYAVYEKFRESLKADMVGYDGMILSDAVSRLETDASIAIPYKKVVFVGFNALSLMERRLFEFFQKRGIADFYWDYDSEFFKGESRAALFMEENRKKFPSVFQLESKDCPKEVFEVIGMPSLVGQTKEAGRILEGLIAKKQLDVSDKTAVLNTAVVLPDEKLLLPLLHSIPDAVQSLNVTMGYPLSLAPIHSLVFSLMELQRNVRADEKNRVLFYFKDVQSVLNHQYIRLSESGAVDELLFDLNRTKRFWVDCEFLNRNDLFALLFQKQDSVQDKIHYFIQVIDCLYAVWQQEKYVLEQEFLFQYRVVLNQLSENLEASCVEISSETFYSILNQLVRGTHIPFKGEPLAGLQVMGVLETRSLDFENLIITSVNEDVFPKRENKPSVIPYNLRRGFDLPTNEDQDAMLSYHFYRLLSGAKRVFLIYDLRENGVNVSEVSRFVNQLKYHYSHIKLTEKCVLNRITNDVARPISIEKTAEVCRRIESFSMQGEGSDTLSASDLNAYMECPLRFYFSKIARLKIVREMDENIESNVFGSIFHRVMELFYSPYLNIQMTSGKLDELESNQMAITKLVNRSFTEVYLNRKDGEIVLPKGRNELVVDIIRNYFGKAVAYDKQSAPFVVKRLEHAVSCRFPIFGGKKWVNLKGFVDRIHEKEGELHILDYKTGKEALSYKNIPELFDKTLEKRKKAIFQTFMYALMCRYDEMHPELMMKDYPVKMDVYSLPEMSGGNYVSEITNEERAVLYSDVSDEFERGFTELVEELFNPDIAFVQCGNAKKCTICDYKDICGR